MDEVKIQGDSRLGRTTKFTKLQSFLVLVLHIMVHSSPPLLISLIFIMHGPESPKSKSSSIIFDKPSSTINIKHAIPLVLDLDKMNYGVWRELFELHCIGYGVVNHLQPPNEKQPSTSNLDEHDRLDSIVKSWLYETISTSLLQLIFKKKSSCL